MILRPPRSTRTNTLFPYTTLFRSIVTFPVGQREMATTQPEQTPVQMQHRARVPKLRLHIAASPVRMERQPRRPFRKAAVQRGVPRHWRAGRVAPKAEARLAQLTRVLQLIGRYRHLADPDLVPLIKCGRERKSVV